MGQSRRLRKAHVVDSRRVVVKIGSSLISDGQKLSDRKIDDLAEVIARLQNEGREMLITSSGAIAAGMARLGLNRRPQHIPEKQAAAAIGQSYLIWAYERAFSRRGCQVAQILLTQDEFSYRNRYLNARNTLFTLLSHKVIPIANENDCVAMRTTGVFSPGRCWSCGTLLMTRKPYPRPLVCRSAPGQFRYRKNPASRDRTRKGIHGPAPGKALPRRHALPRGPRRAGP